MSTRQLLALGISRGSIDHRLVSGQLHRIHRGVYAVGHPSLAPRGRWMAAVLACGQDAALSHRSAAALWGLHAAPGGRVDVASPRRAQSRAGIRVHRIRELAADEVTVVDGIRVTTVARTLLDLSAGEPRRALERALDASVVLRLFDLDGLEALLVRHGRRPGTAALRAVLADHAVGTTVTRSELEERLLALCDAARLPRPELNVALTLPDGGVATVDALWRTQRLIVEADGRQAHLTAAAFERDRYRDAQLTLAGYRVVRFTWRQVTRHHRATTATLRGLLGTRIQTLAE